MHFDLGMLVGAKNESGGQFAKPCWRLLFLALAGKTSPS